MSVPVEKIVTAPVFRTLPRRSLIPGSIVIVYAVFARHPRRGRTATSDLCQSTFGSPSRGEMRKSAWRFGAPAGRSLTTSSNRKITSFGLTPTWPLSGAIATILGAAVSTGPPGGTPGEAHAATAPLIPPAMKLARSRHRCVSFRRAPSLSRSAESVSRSTPRAFVARTRRPQRARAK